MRPEAAASSQHQAPSTQHQRNAKPLPSPAARPIFDFRFSIAGGLGAYRGLGASAAARAIASAEGFGQPGAVPTQANNPGDLKLGDLGYGVTVAAGGERITNFPSAAAGWAALESQIARITSGTSTAGYRPDMTIAQVGRIYSGGDPNWARNVAAALGVSPDAVFADAAGGWPSNTLHPAPGPQSLAPSPPAVVSSPAILSVESEPGNPDVLAALLAGGGEPTSSPAIGIAVAGLGLLGLAWALS